MADTFPFGSAGEAFVSDWTGFERDHLWHPYAPMIDPNPAWPVASASAARLMLADGRELIDGMASWWCAIHGYNHPVLNAAIEAQLGDMAHVMFGGLTHKPAAALAARLIDLAPEPLQYVFLADSGSVAVEVAMKMALQYWQSKGRPERHRLLTIRNGYHGDTFGAMSVCDPVTGMHHLFARVLPQQLFAAAPVSRTDAEWDERDIADFAGKLAAHNDEIAAVILEPIVQGAGGMRFYAPEFLRRVRALCDEHDVLLIADEIATGFGRTGRMFACEHAGITPDIMCIGKALTGGYMSLAATLVNDRVCNGIHAGHDGGVLMHGPTFMGNPLACAVANASIDLLLSSDWRARVAGIEAGLNAGLEPCRSFAHVADVRVLGAIGVVELEEPVDMTVIQRAFVEAGVWVRPFGKLVYLMPPFVITDAELAALCEAVVSVVGNN